MRKPDIVIFIEHVARELDAACCLKSLLEDRGHTVHVASTVFGLSHVPREVEPPRVVVMPYCYVADLGGYQEILHAWPHATYVNLGYEQLTHPINRPMKAPRDYFSQNCVLHVAWSEDCLEWMAGSGTCAENIHRTGNMILQMYKEPYARYFATRETLGEQHGLDPSKRWVLLASNYAAAFYTDKDIRRKYVDAGVPAEEANSYRSYARQSLNAVAPGIQTAATRFADTVELIVRPKPATPRDHYLRTWKIVGTPPANLHFIKSGTVREWNVASDVVMSSWSTTLIEAALSMTPMYMMMPVQLPEYLSHPWHAHVPKLQSEEQLFEVLDRPLQPVWEPLRDWTEQHLMAWGDPMLNIADLVDRAARGEAAPAEQPTVSCVQPSAIVKHVWRLRKLAGRILLGADRLHEHDEFDTAEVDRRASTWKQVLDQVGQAKQGQP